MTPYYIAIALIIAGISILAYAIKTAPIVEDDPYREGMSDDEFMEWLRKMESGQ